MNAPTFEASRIRAALLDAIPPDLAEHGEPPEERFMYLPRGHARALSLDSGLVVGGRGAGKSFWWAALQSAELRRLIRAELGPRAVDERTHVVPGFGVRTAPDRYPSGDTLASILATDPASERLPRQVWTTVVLHSVGGLPELADWRERVSWVVAHPEEVERRLVAADAELVAAGETHLVVFDALDRTADTWDDLRRLLRGMLRTLLTLRPFRALRAKAFVRPDMLEDEGVKSFPDASKVLAGRVELSWPRNELYGLLWQRLGNAREEGEHFRQVTATLARPGQVTLAPEAARAFRDAGVWPPPDALRSDRELQRSVFHAISGPYMGRGARRGLPYTWLPNHLGDTRGQVSPRSFLTALRTAAEDAQERFADHDFALHYEALKSGVQKASEERVTEVKEDHPWVSEACVPLAGLVIPCSLYEIEELWERNDTLARLATARSWQAPRRLAEGPRGLFEDLFDLGILQRMRDGRINMPDVYRVGFGLGRRGGVKPVR